MVAIRIVEEVNHSQALLERRRMWHSGRDEVLLPAAIGLEGSADREVELASGGVAGSGAQRVARQASPILAQARQYESRLVEAIRQLEVQVAQRVGQLTLKIQTEQVNLAKYQQQLDALDGEARDLVGHVAQRNFGLVRDKLRNIVLRADVGITEQAWEVREEELDRVRSLQSERSRQEQLLDEELKEVRDDGVEPVDSSK